MPCQPQNSFPNIGISYVYGHGSSTRRYLLYISPASMNGCRAPSTPFAAYCCLSRKAHSASPTLFELAAESAFLVVPSPLVFATRLISSLQIQHFFYRVQCPPPLIYPCLDPDCPSVQCVWQTFIPSRYVAPASKCANLSFCVSA